MAPKMPDEYRAARRAQIIGAAAECFLDKGFHQTTMQDIFEASGLSAGAVYNYFDSKEEIVAAMGELSGVRNTAIASRALLSDSDEPIAAALESFLAILKSPEAGRWAPFDIGMYAEAARNEKIRASIQENVSVTADALVPLIEELQVSGALSPELDARSIIIALSMLVQGMQTLRVIDPDADLDAYAEACVAIARGDLRIAKSKKKRKEA